MLTQRVRDLGKMAMATMVVILGLGLAAAASPVKVTFEGGTGGPVTVRQGRHSSRVYYYPYTLKFDATGTTLQVACDDYQDQVSQGETWWVNESTFGNLSQTMFYDHGNGVDTYKQAMLLFSQILNPGNSSYVGAINFAIWDLFDSGAPSLGRGSSYKSDSAYWLNFAANAANLAAFDTTGYVVFTPTSWNGCGSRPQEMLGYIPPPASPVPEPATWALWLTGVFALGAYEWRRRQRQALA